MAKYLSQRDYGLAANALRLHGRKLMLDVAEMRESAVYPGDLIICDILDEQAKEEIALADRIEEMELCE